MKAQKAPFDRFQGSDTFPDDGHFFDEPEKLPWYADTPHWSPVIDFHSTLTIPMPWDSKQAREACLRVLDNVFGVGAHSMSVRIPPGRSERPQNPKNKGKKIVGGSNTSTRLAILPSESAQLGML